MPAVRDCQRDGYTYIILLSGADERADVLSGMEAGAGDYLIKPLDPFGLQTRLLAARRVTLLHEELDRARRKLVEQANTDPLTNLRNRLGLSNDLEMLHNISKRYERSYCLGLCDVHFFKSYNDTYGHQAGDEALRLVADTLNRHVRETDRVYRYGGEEFLFLLPEQQRNGGVHALNRIRRAVEQLGITHATGGPAGVLTVSIGVSAFAPGRSVTSEELLAEADRSLYEAKAAGRNSVLMAA